MLAKVLAKVLANVSRVCCFFKVWSALYKHVIKKSRIMLAKVLAKVLANVSQSVSQSVSKC